MSKEPKRNSESEHQLHVIATEWALALRACRSDTEAIALMYSLLDRLVDVLTRRTKAILDGASDHSPKKE